MKRPLAGPDARIFDLLQRIITMGRNNRSWSRDDVLRVVDTWMRPRPVRAPADHQRAEKLESKNRELRAEVARLRAQLAPATDWEPPVGTGQVRVGVVTPLQAAVLDGMCQGKRKVDIARELRMSDSAVRNHAWRAAQRLGADQPLHAVVLILTGRLQVRVKVHRAAG